MTNKQLAKELRNIGEALWTKTFDPNFKLLLDEASERLEQVEAETARKIFADIRSVLTPVEGHFYTYTIMNSDIYDLKNKYGVED